MNGTEEMWEFVEPHPTGGVCTVRISTAQIVAYMRQRKDFDHSKMDDWELVSDFSTVHWARRISS